MGSRSKQKEVRKETLDNKVNEAKQIQVQPGNISVLTIQLLNSINQNLASLIGYLKHRDMENGRHK